MDNINEIVTGFENFVTALHALRYWIGAVIITGFIISAWGWWNKITV